MNSELKIIRKTNETDITLIIDFEKSYEAEILTDLGFFNHMINTLAKYLDVKLYLNAKGDLYVDSHHLIEDIGIVFGQLIRKKIDLDNKIKRFSSNTIPMDDSLILLALDLSGRSFLNYDININIEYIGNIETVNFKEFFMKLTNNAMINLHIKKFYGENPHHIIENIFKVFGICLKEALYKNDSILSTKGSIGGSK